MFLSPSLPPALAAALSISPTIFMASTVMTACVCGIIVVFNYLSLKYRSTDRYCVLSPMLFLAGLLVADASVGLTFESDSSDLLATLPGKIAFACFALAALIAVFGFVHCYRYRHRFRRGRKRAVASLIFSLIAMLALFKVSQSARHPQIAIAPKSRVELLPETDAYGRPLRTPAPTPAASIVAATPAPAPLPVPEVQLTPPRQIATPTPARLLPKVIFE